MQLLGAGAAYNSCATGSLLDGRLVSVTWFTLKKAWCLLIVQQYASMVVECKMEVWHGRCMEPGSCCVAFEEGIGFWGSLTSILEVLLESWFGRGMLGVIVCMFVAQRALGFVAAPMECCSS